MLIWVFLYHLLNDENVDGSLAKKIKELVDAKNKGELGMTAEQSKKLDEMYETIVKNAGVGLDSLMVTKVNINPDPGNMILIAYGVYNHSSGGRGYVNINVPGGKEYADISAILKGFTFNPETDIPKASDYNWYLWIKIK